LYKNEKGERKMKVTKRFLSVLLSLCLVLGMLPGTAFAASGNLPFTDVNTADWYYDAVQYVYDKGMMSGTSSTTFEPDATTTRGMIVTILHRMEGTPSAIGAAFTDVPAGQWYTDAVAWASANDIVGGYGNGTFGPDDPITREQMATILHRYSQRKGYDPSTSDSIGGFTDGTQVSSYAVDSMNWAIGNGLISGVGNNMLVPADNSTRAQVATILMRFCENIVPVNKDETTPTPDTSVDTTYTVAFDLNYGNNSVYSSQTVKQGETVQKPDAPSRSGHSFSGWYTTKSGGTKFDFTTVITENLTLYAHWNQKSSSGNSSNPNSGSSIPPEFTLPETTAPGKIMYKAPSESDIDSGIIECEGQPYIAKYVKNQLIVVFKDGINNGEAERLIGTYGGSIVGEIETIGIYQVEFDSVKTVTELNSISSELKTIDFVEDAYLNTVVECEDTITQYYPTNDTWDTSDDPDPSWDELNPQGNNWGVEAINAPSAWKLLIDRYGTISQVPSVRVGVIDSYIDMTHDDLKESGVGIYTYISGINLFKKNQISTTAAEFAAAADNGEDYAHFIHGTHVMGTIGATIDNGGISGIALNPKLYGVSIAETDESYVHTRFGLSTALSNLIEDSKCKVINYSMGYSDYDPVKAIKDGEKVGNVLKKYLNKNYDFLIVNSAGNESERDAQYNSFFSAISDATAKSRIIVVGCAKKGDNPENETFSLRQKQSYGSRVDLVAPGVDIYSTVSQNERSFDDDYATYTANSKYMLATGTSMAAPHVSGVAALVWSANPTLTGDRVKDIIIETANIIVDGKDAAGYSHNMVNAAYAVSKALGLEYSVKGTCGSNMTWTLDTAGNLTIQGTGEMIWESNYAPWHRYHKFIRNIKIGDGVTSIYDSAFLNCYKVDTIELSSNIDSIGHFAFGGITNLHSIKIPNSVQKIGNWAFGYIGDNIDTPMNGFTIYGYQGTEAERYAHDNNFKFIDLASESPDEPIDPSSAVISGTVVSSDTNQPIADVDVYLNCIFGEGGEDLGATTKTVTDGTFKLTIPKNATAIASIQFEKEGYNNYLLPLTADVNSSHNVGIISLTPSTVDPLAPAISGLVKDDITNLPIENADVYVYDENGYGPLFTGKTDSNGSFLITLEESGTYTVKFIKDGYAERDESAIVNSGTTLLGVITLISDSPTFAGGDGTEANPYQIATTEQLQNAANDPSGNYILVADINCSKMSDWSPIGTEQNGFSGRFDGKGHTISNLTSSQGLFGYISSTGTVENVNLSGFEVSADQCGGIIAGHNNGVIQYCKISGLINGTTGQYLSNFVGGVAGDNAGTIQYCSVSTGGDESMRGTTIGGIAGRNTGRIISCVSSCSITGKTESNGLSLVGGIVGYNYGGTVNLCKSTSDIVTTVVYAGCACGGIAGANSGTICTNYFNGKVYARATTTNYGARAGGIVGSNGDMWLGKGGTVSQCVYELSEGSSTSKLDASDSSYRGPTENNYDSALSGTNVIDEIEATLSF